MYASCKRSKMSRQFIIHLVILASILMWCTRPIPASEESPDDAGAMVLVLEDCDSDNKLSTDPYGDTISLLDSKGELVRVVSRNIRIKGKFGGFSISEDGRFFAVCDGESNRLEVYKIADGMEKWYLQGISVDSAIFARDLLYAYTPGSVFVINDTGTIVKHARIELCNMAFDQAHDCFWVGGIDVKKYNLDLKPVLEVQSIYGKKGPLLVEVNPDGSIWIAQKDAHERYGSENKMVKVSQEGKLLQTLNLDFSPASVCVNKSDGSVWVTGTIKEQDFTGIGDEMPESLDELNKLVKTNIETFTRKYDSEGNLIFEISEGGYAMELDQSNGSAWIGDKTNIWHYSADGRNIGSYAGTPGVRKWFAIIPSPKSKQIASR